MHKNVLFAFCLLFFSVTSFSQHIDVLNYGFELYLNDANDTLKGEATITFVQLSEKKTATFDLANINSQGKGMLARVRVDKRDNEFNNNTYSHNNDKITVDLPNYNKGDTITLKVSYQGIPADGLIISKNKYGDRTFFADNWPNRAHFWLPCNDVPNDKASFEFDITAPSQYVVISNGNKIFEKEIGHGLKLTRWKENVSLPTKVMVIGVAKFAVKTFPDSPPNIPVSAWIYQQDSTRGFRDYAPAVEILKFFSNYIAPYPYEKLANVQSKTIFGGMENASAIFYAESSVTGKGGVEDLLAHEIAHQWFGDMASEKTFAHLWLSEGFATYLTDIYWQHKFGEEAFRKRLQKEREEVIGFVKTNNRPVVDSLSPFMDLLNANSYQKGAWVLHMLRNEVGDSIFQRIIQTYYQQYKGSNADTRDFEAVAEKVSGKNLKWFFDQWLYQPGIPKLNANWKMDGNKIKIEIKQSGKLTFQIPIEIGVVSANGKMVIQKFYIKSREEEFKIETSSNPAKLVLDPNTNLLYEGSLSQK